MSYACFSVIYGVPLMPKSKRRTVELEDFIEDRAPGVIKEYSGSSNPIPAAFGIELDSFDECAPYIDIDSLSLKPTAEHLAKYSALVSALTEEEQDLLKPFGEPRVFFLTSTS